MSKTLLVWIGTLLLCAILSVTMGAVWWGLWMNHGWPGASGVLAKLLNAQGDHYYDAMQDEMTFWWFSLFLIVGVVAIRRTANRIRRRP